MKLEDATESVLYGLTALIQSTLRQHEGECSAPKRAADGMDHFISATALRVLALRRLREDFENEMAKSLELDPR